ncbi:collagen alpha-1(I) chain-like [Myotis myotis]|uniref:collagen alpha-1(I) chain-like n=1 Tax=Myotis myotis TaxID=51298 RepID=UPI00174A5376|nr:collagen alpha-1(I) chain-like [Myotis myotis]
MPHNKHPGVPREQQSQRCALGRMRGGIADTQGEAPPLAARAARPLAKKLTARVSALGRGAEPGRSASAGAGTAPLEGGGRRARGARQPLRPAPLPPGGSCPDRGRRLVFPEGSASVRLRISAGTWEGGSPAQEERSWARTCSRTAARHRDAPLSSVGGPSPVCGRGEAPRSLARGGGEGLGAGGRSRRRDWKLLALPAGLARRVASPGREGRSVGRPAGREWLLGVPRQRWAPQAALGAPPGTCVFLVSRAPGAHSAQGTNKNPAGVSEPFPANASACGAPGGPLGGGDSARCARSPGGRSGLGAGGGRPWKRSSLPPGDLWVAATTMIFHFGFKNAHGECQPRSCLTPGGPLSSGEHGTGRPPPPPPPALRGAPRPGQRLHGPLRGNFGERKFPFSRRPRAWTEGLPAARRVPCGLCGAKPTGGCRRSPSPAVGCRAGERVWKGPHPGLGRRGPPAALGEPPPIPPRLPGGPIPHPPPFVPLSRLGVESGRKKIIRWKSKIKRGALAA